MKNTRRIQKLNETLNDVGTINESGRHRSLSIQYLIDDHFWPSVVDLLQHEVGKKYLTFRSLGFNAPIWAIEFDGVNKSDLSVEGYVALSEDHGDWSLRLAYKPTDAKEYNKTWKFRWYGDAEQYVKDMATTIKKLNGE